MTEPKDYNIDEILKLLGISVERGINQHGEWVHYYGDADGQLYEMDEEVKTAKAHLYELITKEIIGEDEDWDVGMIDVTGREVDERNSVRQEALTKLDKKLE